MSTKPGQLQLTIAAVVVVGGMIFAKFGQNTGWPWWVYYTIPALVTMLVPPLVLRFSAEELWQYLALAALSSPVIHVLSSFLLGWHDYMPFIRVPSIHELLSNDQVRIEHFGGADVVGDHLLRLEFDDHTAKTVNCLPLLDGPVFEPLQDPAYFARVVVDPLCGTVVWPDGADFAPEALYELPNEESERKAS